MSDATKSLREWISERWPDAPYLPAAMDRMANATADDLESLAARVEKLEQDAGAATGAAGANESGKQGPATVASLGSTPGSAHPSRPLRVGDDVVCIAQYETITEIEPSGLIRTNREALLAPPGFFMLKSDFDRLVRPAPEPPAGDEALVERFDALAAATKRAESVEKERDALKAKLAAAEKTINDDRPDASSYRYLCRLYEAKPGRLNEKIDALKAEVEKLKSAKRTKPVTVRKVTSGDFIDLWDKIRKDGNDPVKAMAWQFESAARALGFRVRVAPQAQKPEAAKP